MWQQVLNFSASLCCQISKRRGKREREGPKALFFLFSLTFIAATCKWREFQQVPPVFVLIVFARIQPGRTQRIQLLSWDCYPILLYPNLVFTILTSSILLGSIHTQLHLPEEHCDVWKDEIKNVDQAVMGRSRRAQLVIMSIQCPRWAMGRLIIVTATVHSPPLEWITAPNTDWELRHVMVMELQFGFQLEALK